MGRFVNFLKVDKSCRHASFFLLSIITHLLTVLSGASITPCKTPAAYLLQIAAHVSQPLANSLYSFGLRPSKLFVVGFGSTSSAYNPTNGDN